ncbi:MAG: LLM class flavin-dependent oxidoreductase [Dehalococcoidia bacterium]
MPLEIHIGGPASAPLTQQVAFIKRAEELGFDGVGIADNVQDGHDVYVALALAAEQTSKIQLYPAITNPVTRHPFVLASLANSLAELAPGRTKLAIGTGDTGVTQAGLKPATINELRGAIQIIQQLLRGDSVRFDAGGEGLLRDPRTPAPPVAVAASGPRALELAAEVGDEVMLTVGLDPRIIKAVEPHLAKGANKAGRSFNDLRVTYYTIVSIHTDGEIAREAVYPLLLQWLRQGMFRVGLDALGIQIPEDSTQSDLSKDTLDKLCGLLSIAGTPSEVRKQFTQLASDGMGRVFCMALGDEASHAHTMELIAEHVIPAVR